MFGGALGIFGTDAKKMVGCLPLATSSRALSDHELRLFPKCYMLNLITDDYSLVASNSSFQGMILHFGDAPMDPFLPIPSGCMFT